MVYTLKLNNEIVGNVTRVVDRIGTDPDLGLICNLTITFVKQQSYDSLVAQARKMATEDTDYVLSVVDEQDNIVYTTARYHILKEAQIVIDSNASEDEQDLTYFWVLE